MERKETTMAGNPVTLVGPKLETGEAAPDFTVVDTGMQERHLADYEGKYKLISVVPSLDTSVCDLQTRRFNHEAAGLGEDVVILTISMDLPFAQSRWCGANESDRVITLSDHREGSFGRAYGVLIKELRLLNRSVFLLDKTNTIRYFEIVKENTQHPDYDSAVRAVMDLR